MSTQTLKLQKTDSEFLKVAGILIIDNNGKKFYHIPYWYEEIGEGLFVEHSFNKLPIELKQEIERHRSLLV